MCIPNIGGLEAGLGLKSSNENCVQVAVDFCGTLPQEANTP